MLASNCNNDRVYIFKCGIWKCLLEDSNTQTEKQQQQNKRKTKQKQTNKQANKQANNNKKLLILMDNTRRLQIFGVSNFLFCFDTHNDWSFFAGGGG